MTTLSERRPLISVIVPIYNAGAYLDECLNSLRAQTYDKLELICIDDGSTDNSSVILQRHAKQDKRIVALSQQNKGQAAARNKGLEIASGEWITGIDADDYLQPEAYEYALSLASDEVDMVCFSSLAVGGAALELRKSEVSYLINKLEGLVTSAQQILTNTNVYFWNKLWRKSFIDGHRLRFNEGLWYEDAAFAYSALPLVRAAAYGKKAVHNYRVHENSTMTRTFNKNSRVLEHLVQLEHVLDFYKEHNITEKLPQAVPFVFRNLFGATLGHIHKSLKKKALEKASAIVKKFNLRSNYPQEPAIAAACILPWYIKPFLRLAFSKRTYCFFFLPVYTIKYSDNTANHKLFGITLLKSSR